MKAANDAGLSTSTACKQQFHHKPLFIPKARCGFLSHLVIFYGIVKYDVAHYYTELEDPDSRLSFYNHHGTGVPLECLTFHLIHTVCSRKQSIQFGENETMSRNIKEALERKLTEGRLTKLRSRCGRVEYKVSVMGDPEVIIKGRHAYVRKLSEDGRAVSYVQATIKK